MPQRTVDVAECPWFAHNPHNPVQDILIRPVKMSNGKPVNAVLETIPQVADPGA